MVCQQHGPRVFAAGFTVGRAFYRKVKDAPMRVRGSLYLPIFGNHQTARVPFGGKPVPVPGVGVCTASGGTKQQSYFLICSSAFRFPPVLLSYRFIPSTMAETEEVRAFTQPRSISYSPFPAEPGIVPVSQDFTFSIARVALSEARVDTVAPLGYIQRNFEIPSLRLHDFQVDLAPFSP